MSYAGPPINNARAKKRNTPSLGDKQSEGGCTTHTLSPLMTAAQKIIPHDANQEKGKVVIAPNYCGLPELVWTGPRTGN
jgi:hypothetical protein